MEDISKCMTLTDDIFEREVLEAKGPVLVGFWATWCRPCQALAPVIEVLAAQFDGQAIVGKMNVDNNPQVTTRYGINSIPALLYFKDGQIVDRVFGMVPQKILAEKLSRLSGLQLHQPR